MPSLPPKCVDASRSRVSSIGLAAPDPLPAVRVEGGVDDPLGRIELVVTLEAEMPEALRDGIQAGAFGLIPQRVVGVGAVHDPAKQDQGRIAVELVLLHDRLERAFL